MRTYEKSAILEIIRCSKDLDCNDKNQVKAALVRGKQSEVLNKTIFGGRFLKRLNAMADSQEYEHKCVLCERPENGIVCPTCIEQLMPAVEEMEIESQKVAENRKVNNKSSKTATKEKHRHSKQQVVADSEWLMDELVRNMDSSMDRLANKKSVQKINRILIVLIFMGIFDTIGIILIILMLKGVIA